MGIFSRLQQYIKEHSVNSENSSKIVRCIEPEKCDYRHSQMCNTCKNNIGPEPFKNRYVKRDA